MPIGFMIQKMNENETCETIMKWIESKVCCRVLRGNSREYTIDKSVREERKERREERKEEKEDEILRETD